MLDRPWGVRLRKLGPICDGWPPQARQDTRCQARKYPPALYCWSPWTDQTLGCQAGARYIDTSMAARQGNCAPSFWLVFSGPRVIGQGSCAQSFTDVLPSMPCVPGSGSCAKFPHLASLTPVRSMVARPGKLQSSPLVSLYWPGLTLWCQAGKIYHHSQRWPSQDQPGLRVAGRGRYGFFFMAGPPGLAKTCVASLGKMCPLFNDFPSQGLAK